MGVRAWMQRRAIAALLELVGVPGRYRGPVAGAIQHAARKARTVKPGIRTTEFWLTLVTIIGSLGGELAGILPGRAGAVVAAIASAAYALSRGLAKVGGSEPPAPPA
jgi:hypothetical protein